MAINKDSQPIYAYTEVEKQVLARYYGNMFGSYEEEMRLDNDGPIEMSVLIFPPIESQPFYKCATFGMGSYPMPLPENIEGEDLARAELLIYLPTDWPNPQKNPAYAWPVRTLLAIGQSMAEAQTCLGYGTVIPNGKGEAFSPQTGFNSVALLRSLAKDATSLEAHLPKGDRINFYQVFPLYPAEMAFLLDDGHYLRDLLNRFQPKDLSAVVNLNRPAYA